MVPQMYMVLPLVMRAVVGIMRAQTLIVQNPSHKSAPLLHNLRPPGPKDLSQLPDSGPTCPDLKRFPTTEYSNQLRSFNKNWGDQHSWLEYSRIQDAAFSFVCHHFTRASFSKAEKSFTHEGFRNWKKATTSLKAHDNSAEHVCYGSMGRV